MTIQRQITPMRVFPTLLGSRFEKIIIKILLVPYFVPILDPILDPIFTILSELWVLCGPVWPRLCQVPKAFLLEMSRRVCEQPLPEPRVASKRPHTDAPLEQGPVYLAPSRALNMTLNRALNRILNRAVNKDLYATLYRACYCPTR